jgi:hypothetical protein
MGSTRIVDAEIFFALTGVEWARIFIITRIALSVGIYIGAAITTGTRASHTAILVVSACGTSHELGLVTGIVGACRYSAIIIIRIEAILRG